MPGCSSPPTAHAIVHRGTERTYILKSIIGRGVRSVVLSAYCPEDGCTYAVKTVSKTIERCVSRVRREIAILQRVARRHPNIIKLVDVFENDDTIFMCFDLMHRTLLSVCCKEGKLPVHRVKQLLGPLASALAFLHSQGIAHLDVKLENIMIDNNLQPVLIDFGFAEEIAPDSLLQRGKGSFNYLSPEIVRREAYDPRKADVWSLGIVLFAMVTARFPFDDRRKADPQVIMELIRAGELEVPDDVPSLVADLLLKMLERDPRRRPDMESVLKHPLFCTSSAF